MGYMTNPIRQEGASIPFKQQAGVGTIVSDIVTTAVTDVARLVLSSLVIYGSYQLYCSFSSWKEERAQNAFVARIQSLSDQWEDLKDTIPDSFDKKSFLYLQEQLFTMGHLEKSLLKSSPEMRETVLTSYENVLKQLKKAVDESNTSLLQRLQTAMDGTAEKWEEKLKKPEKNVLTLERKLSERILGQEAAIGKISQTLRNHLSGLADREKPIGSFLLVGPTGTGKTETAKIIAEELFGDRNAVLFLNGPEYTGPTDVSRLLGSPVGFADYEEGGLLTNFIKNHPQSVILVDEIEKGSVELRDLFLKILDEGKIEDMQGNSISCKDTVIIFTSNAGAESGFTERALKKTFRPEFLARIDDVVQFTPLSEDMISRIVDLEIEKIRKRAEKQGITVDISERFKKSICKKVLENRTGKGAREVSKFVHEAIDTPIAEKILIGNEKTFFLDCEEKTPLYRMSEADRKLQENLRSLGVTLSSNIVGQPAVAREIPAALSLRLAGLGDEKKPMGAFLFTGPTGCGKTESAKLIARDFLQDPQSLLFINGPEYVHEIDIHRLIGATPGYVGYEQGGVLTNFIQNRPYSVILVDELEKGHRQLQDMFLKILDEGKLEDAQGNSVDFKNTIIIFTSNVGAQTDNPDLAIQKSFRPEFLGRVKVVPFNGISREMNTRIVDIEVENLCKKMAARGITLHISDPVKHFLYAKAFADHARLGAREVKTIVNRYVSVPLATRILSEEAGGYEVKMGNNSVTILPIASGRVL